MTNQDVQTTASMALDVIRHAQSTVEIIIATYSMEPVLHVDQDGQMRLVKQVQLFNYLNRRFK